MNRRYPDLLGQQINFTKERIGMRGMDIGQSCWRHSFNPAVFVEPVIKLLTGSMSGKPRDVESWINIKPLLFPRRISGSTLLPQILEKRFVPVE